MKFKECASCAAKTGSPLLCEACLHNRELAEKLKKAERALSATATHQDDCDRVQDPSGRAHCTCAEIGRAQRRKIQELCESNAKLQRELNDACDKHRAALDISKRYIKRLHDAEAEIKKLRAHEGTA